MNPQVIRHSPAWITFTYVSFAGALAIMFAPIDIWIKGYFGMGTLMLVQSCITVTKTVRDVQESAKLMNRIDEDAKTERLLMEIDRVKE